MLIVRRATPPREAIQWTGENLEEVKKLCPYVEKTENGLFVPNSFLGSTIQPGYYIVKGGNEYWTYSPEDFRVFYNIIKEKETT